jgi:hypothetical protein
MSLRRRKLTLQPSPYWAFAAFDTLQYNRTITQMKIYHDESNVCYEIAEQKGGYKLVDLKTNRTYSFKESYEAIWYAIELLRMSSFDTLREEDLSPIWNACRFSIPFPKTLLNAVKREKVNRTYYDQVFMRVLTQFRSGVQEIHLTNNSNFSIQHELTHLIRQTMGQKAGSALAQG